MGTGYLDEFPFDLDSQSGQKLSKLSKKMSKIVQKLSQVMSPQHSYQMSQRSHKVLSVTVSALTVTSDEVTYWAGQLKTLRAQRDAYRGFLCCQLIIIPISISWTKFIVQRSLHCSKAVALVHFHCTIGTDEFYNQAERPGICGL